MFWDVYLGTVAGGVTLFFLYGISYLALKKLVG